MTMATESFDNDVDSSSPNYKWRPNGMLFVRVPSKTNPDEFWIMGLSFFGPEDLKPLLEYCNRMGFKPHTDIINLKVGGVAIPDQIQEDGPSCPYHGDKYVRRSKKFKGLFCGAKLKDGNYCSWEQRD